MYTHSEKNQIPKKLQLNPKLKSSLPVTTTYSMIKVEKKNELHLRNHLVASKKKLVIIVVHNQAIFINLRNSTLKKNKKNILLLTSLKTSY